MTHGMFQKHSVSYDRTGPVGLDLCSEVKTMVLKRLSLSKKG